MGIVDDIKANTVEELHLSNVPEDYFGETKEFVDAMNANTSIKRVILDGEFLASAVGKERADIVSAVGSLPNVESVTLNDSLLLVGICVANMVKNAKSLQELSIEKCLLQGIPDDFDTFKDALKNNAAVKKVHIAECNAANDKVNLTTVMSNLKEGLSVDVSGSGS
jgi:hypothetical protein